MEKWANLRFLRGFCEDSARILRGFFTLFVYREFPLIAGNIENWGYFFSKFFWKFFHTFCIPFLVTFYKSDSLLILFRYYLLIWRIGGQIAAARTPLAFQMANYISY
jgi:hypothetical protein